MSAEARAYRTTTLATLGLAIAPALPLAAWPLSAGLVVGPFLEAAIPFAGGTITAILPLAIAARAALSTRFAIALAAAAALVVGAIAIANPAGILPVVAIDGALVVLAHALGGSLGRRVEHPGHLLPACVVAAVADLVSVLHPAGPTHAIVRSERALSLLAVSFPVPGVRAVAPVIGLGDLLFIALVLGVAERHGLSIVRVALAALVGAVIAGIVSATIQGPAPALVAIAAAVIAFVPQARAVRPQDRATTKAAIVLAIAVGGALFLQKWMTRQ